MIECAAVLWDLDGTIVDTEPMWIAAETELAEAHGQVWTTEDALRLVGNSLLASGEYIRTRLGLDMTPEEVVDFLVSHIVEALSHDVPWRPGAVELIRALADEGVPQALVTMSYAPIAEPILAALPFAAAVTGDAVPRPKPFPDPYELAAAKLGVDPAHCIAIEDSPTGAASATSAGCWVAAVPHMVAVDEAPRRVLLPTLDGVTPTTLRDAFV